MGMSPDDTDVSIASSDYDTRFGNIGRLYQSSGTSLQRLRNAHVCVIGLGGVGSWAVEAIARSGIGRCNSSIS